jgi:hypothetical protein
MPKEDDRPELKASADTPEEPVGETWQVKRGVKDAGDIVSSAGGELIDGRIADITDGDD